MTVPDWLTERPIAHRGLHDRARDRIENSRAAAESAIVHGFAIECDVRLSADGEAIVFHDSTLERLTLRRGPLAELTTAQLGSVFLRGSDETIPSLPDLLSVVSGRVPLIVEIKSRFDGDLRLARRTARILEDYEGPVALKSFDPAVVALLREIAPERPRGIVGQAVYAGEWCAGLSAGQRHVLTDLLHYADSLPDFLSWRVGDLYSAAPYLCRAAAGLPVLAWTVRTDEERHHARRHADQMIFEGFVP
jgi:glycerophosphoryl diester phosphodiesterase